MSDPLVRAAHLIELRRFEQAQAELAALVAEDPGSAAAHRLMVAACLGRGQTDGAVAWAGHGLAHSPHDPALHLAHSEALHHAGRHRSAARAATNAVRLQPDDAEAHRWLATALSHQRGRHASALRSAQEGVRLAPNDSVSWHTLGYVLHTKDRAGARAAYERALSLDPTNPLTRLNLATLDVRRTPFATIDVVTEVLGSEPTLRDARGALISSLDVLIRVLLLVAVVGLQVLGRADLPHQGWVLAGWSAVIAVLAGVAFRRLPAPVRRNLGQLVAPGLTSNRWAIACVLVGPPTTAVGLIWASHEDPRANPPAFVIVAGVALLACGLIGISTAIKRHRARAE